MQKQAKTVFAILVCVSIVTVAVLSNIRRHNPQGHLPVRMCENKAVPTGEQLINATQNNGYSSSVTERMTTTPRTVLEDWEVAIRFQRRLRRMEDFCKPRSNEPSYHALFTAHAHVLVNVYQRLLVCAVPKSGSSSWHRLMWSVERRRLNISQENKFYTKVEIQKLQTKSWNLNDKMWNKLMASTTGDDDLTRDPPPNSSFRVILARHPFARFISGWNQKFLLKINYWVYLLHRFPKLIYYKKEIDPDRVFSFGDFARFAAENIKDVRITDGHFTPATVTCQPCHSNYTYVVKAESVDADEAWLLKRFGLSELALPRAGIPPGGSAVNKDLKGNIKKFMRKLSPSTIRGLYELYKDDFEMFGYTFDFDTLEAGGFD